MRGIRAIGGGGIWIYSLVRLRGAGARQDCLAAAADPATQQQSTPLNSNAKVPPARARAPFPRPPPPFSSSPPLLAQRSCLRFDLLLSLQELCRSPRTGTALAGGGAGLTAAAEIARILC